MISFFTNFAAACPGGDFLGFPKWYKYLQGATTPDGLCTPQLTHINDIWLIVAAIIEMLMRLAAFVAFFYVVYGGVQFMTSQGEPDKTSKARTTIFNALTGLVGAILSAAIVSFVARSFN